MAAKKPPTIKNADPKDVVYSFNHCTIEGSKELLLAELLY